MAGGEKRGDQWPMLAALLAVNVFWGGSFIANAIALRSLGPIEIASLRFFIATPLLVIVTWLWKGRDMFKIDRKDLGVIVIMAITGVTLQYIIQVTAQSYTSAINASLLINTSVFFILILSAAFLAERITAGKVAGAILGFGGVVLLVTGDNLSFDLGKNVLGDLMILFCALLWAIYSIYGKKIATRYHPLTVLNYLFIIGTIGIVPFYFMTPHASLATISLPAAGAILFLAVFCSIIAYLVYNVALQTMDATRVALFIYFVPLSTIVLAALILGESLTFVSAVGGLAVLAGIFIAERR